MSVQLTFYGAAAYRIVTAGGSHVLIDPFLNKNVYSPVKTADLERVDLLVLTHAAFDHFGDAPEILRRFRCPVIAAKDVLHLLERVHGIDPALFRVTIWGFLQEVAGIQVQAVESRHWSFAVTPDGQLLSGPAVGYIIEASARCRIYHPGDTALTQDMKLWGERYRPTVGLMHVTLPAGEGVSLPHMECYKTGEITPQEAYLASEWLGLEHIIASHYVDPACQDVQDFLELARAADRHDGRAPRVTVMKPGETLTLE